MATDYVYISFNGDTSAASGIQGDTIGLGANLTGSWVWWEGWIDLDGSGDISLGDKFFQIGLQVDQDSLGNQGMPDINPAVGFVTSPGFVTGSPAPYTYILKAIDGGDLTSATDTSRLNPLPSPGALLSGTVSFVPPGPSLENVELIASGNTFQGWGDFSDIAGDYTIGLPSFTLGDSANVGSDEGIFGYVTPQEIIVIVADTVTGIDFVYRRAAATVSGSVKDSNNVDLFNGVEVVAQPLGRDGFLVNGFYFLNFDTTEIGNWNFEVRGLPPNCQAPPPVNLNIGIGDSLTFNITVSCGPLGVEEGNSEYRTPNIEMKLFQNDPNPFHGITTIRYQIPATSHVSLNIYDLTGRLIRTLIDDRKEEGVYVLSWNGRNNIGQRVPSGIYFYRFQSSDFSATQKMVFLR
ncbi:T9SS type A sorting domain-containing protein [candidate division TA06 bacterium]|nr:T9SS type A sorting domain-containing protein [candidate division TA06 bacterium]